MHCFLQYFIVALWLVCVQATIPQGPCFEFQGNSFIHFTPINFVNQDAIHYRFQFKTQQANGILMFTVGDENHATDERDVEALYIRDGFLRYHIFNPAPSGIENSFGGYFMIPQAVDIDEWITVHVYRNWPIRNNRRQRRYNQTGIQASINGQAYSDTDDVTRNGINLSSTVYFGGYKDRVSRTVHRFVGQIRNIGEETNHVAFDTPSLNYGSEVMAC